MPRASRDEPQGGDGGGSRKRYAATVEKGENAWKREWSSFMSGVSLKRLRDGTSGVALKASADIERHVESDSAAAANDVGVNSDGIPLDARAGGAGFSYLFSSAAERRAERETRERADQERRRAEKRAQMAKADPLSVLSKHQRALYDAAQRGLQMEGMNRKARRDFLHLTVTEAQQRAEEQSREFKLHDLMDEKLAWYQQGPHPVDLIAEKLVRRKAEKKAKQLGLRYNYLAPHASWLAKRAQRRRESLLVGLGKRLVFREDYEAGEDAEMTVTDPLRHQTVPLCKMALLLTPSTTIGVAGEQAAAVKEAAEEEKEAVEAAVALAMKEGGSDRDDASDREEEKEEDGERQEMTTQQQQRQLGTSSSSISGEEAGPAGPARLPDVGVLQDPARLASSYVRRVVRDRATAVAIQQMNRTTTFLSSDLVKGPSILPEDTAVAKGLPAQLVGGSGSGVGFLTPAVAAPSPKRPTRASAAPSFSPYAPVAPVEEEAAPVKGTSSPAASPAPAARKRVRAAAASEAVEVPASSAVKRKRTAQTTSFTSPSATATTPMKKGKTEKTGKQTTAAKKTKKA